MKKISEMNEEEFEKFVIDKQKEYEEKVKFACLPKTLMDEKYCYDTEKKIAIPLDVYFEYLEEHDQARLTIEKYFFNLFSLDNNNQSLKK